MGESKKTKTNARERKKYYKQEFVNLLNVNLVRKKSFIGKEFLSLDSKE